MNRKGVTIIEIIIVLAVIGVLGTVAVVALNPVEVFKQGKDSRRITDITAIHGAIGVFSNEAPVLYLGDPQTIYVSVPDQTLTGNATSTCGSLGFSAPPPGWKYNCVSPDSLRKVNGTGWIPADFTQLPYTSILSELPVDPTNTVSSGLYYGYVTDGGTKWAVTSLLDSEKLLKEKALGDGGTDPARFEAGSDFSLWANATGLVGYWRFEGDATDASGNGNNLTNSLVSFVSGKLGQGASFNGVDSILYRATSPSLEITDRITLVGWIMPNVLSGNQYIIDKDVGLYGLRISLFQKSTAFIVNGSTPSAVTDPSVVSLNTWMYLASTYDKDGGTSNFKIYKNGALANSATKPGAITPNNTDLSIGNKRTGGSATYAVKGILDDVRVYNRTLTSVEIAAMYKAMK